MYKPYVGGGGPSAQDMIDCNEALCDIIKGESWLCSVNTDRDALQEFCDEYSMSIWDNIHIIKISRNSDDEFIWVGYDRWGFNIDVPDHLVQKDSWYYQLGMEDTLKVIRKFITGKKV